MHGRYQRLLVGKGGILVVMRLRDSGGYLLLSIWIIVLDPSLYVESTCFRSDNRSACRGCVYLSCLHTTDMPWSSPVSLFFASL